MIPSHDTHFIISLKHLLLNFKSYNTIDEKKVDLMNFKLFLPIFLLSIPLVNTAFCMDKFKQAEIVREDGKTLEALNLFNEYIVESQLSGNYNDVLSGLMGELICWQHQFNRTKDRVYAILAKKNAEAMIEIAEEHKIPDVEYKLHFFLAKSYVLLKDYPSAVTEYRRSVELFPTDNAEKGDFIAHLGFATYKSGDKEKGKKLILDGAQQIEKHAEGVDPFLINVWMSGIYLRLADLLRSDNKEEGRYYLDKAQQLINKDTRLVIRKEQLQKLESEYDQK
jgi:tetratricopeptide (TPR) repeat protein